MYKITVSDKKKKIKNKQKANDVQLLAIYDQLAKRISETWFLS